MQSYVNRNWKHVIEARTEGVLSGILSDGFQQNKGVK
jgi:hypothetical protein